MLTVMKKDLREWLKARESGRWTAFSMIAGLVMWGVFFPLWMLEAWVTTPAPAGFFMFLPVFMTLPLVADSFAGERERKTLENLLATRLPDYAIFLGKVAAVATYALAMIFGAELISLITVNIAARGQGLFLYRGMVLVLVILGPIFMTFTVVGVGVLVSLRAKSVRTAMQKLRVGLMLLFFLFMFGPKYLVQVIPPHWGEALSESAGGYGAALSTFLFLALLAAIGLLLLRIGVRRFQRHRLIIE
jgi:ABC-2 type transport system permease protein